MWGPSLNINLSFHFSCTSMMFLWRDIACFCQFNISSDGITGPGDHCAVHHNVCPGAERWLSNDKWQEIIVIFSEDTIEVLCGCQASMMYCCDILHQILVTDISGHPPECDMMSRIIRDTRLMWHSLLTVAWQHFLTWGETWPLHWTQSRSVVCISVSQQCCSLLRLSPCNS